MKIADDLFGRFLVSLLPAGQASPVVVPPRTVLIIRPGGIGDAALVSPVIHVLRERFPGVSIDVLAERRNAGVFELVPGVRKVLLYDTFRGLLSALRSYHDLVIDTEQWYRLSAVVARIARALTRIGFGTNERRRLFSYAVPYSRDDYEAKCFLRLLGPLGISDAGLYRTLSVPGKAMERGQELLGGLSGRPYIVLFPGASIPEKQWAPEKFGQVMQLLHSAGHSWVVIGAESERTVSELICSQVDVLNLTGKTTLAETAAVLSGAMVLVSGDSGVLHLAAALGTSTVSLFGPSSRRKWAPQGDGHRVLQADTECSPCSFFGRRPICARKCICMENISVAEVASAVKELMDERDDQNSE